MIAILFFASFRDITKKKRIMLDGEQNRTIQQLRANLCQTYPQLEKYWDHCIISINQEYTSKSDTIPDGAEVAIFPQVSGGGQEKQIRVRVSRRRIRIERELKDMINPSTGALCVFVGVVRNVSRKKPGFRTVRIEYQAYKTMSEQKMLQIGDEIKDRWPLIQSLILVQRTGTMKPGEVAVVIACSSAHREDGIFDASRYAIERLKQIVPVWKKEIGEDGAHWIEGDYRPGGGD